MALTRCGPFRERRRHADARRRAAWCTAGERRDKSTSSDIVRDGDNVSVWIGFNLPSSDMNLKNFLRASCTS